MRVEISTPGADPGLGDSKALAAELPPRASVLVSGAHIESELIKFAHKVIMMRRASMFIATVIRPLADPRKL